MIITEDERRPCKWQYYFDNLEYRGESQTLEETFCNSCSSGKPSANDGVKNFQNSEINIFINFYFHIQNYLNILTKVLVTDSNNINKNWIFGNANF